MAELGAAPTHPALAACADTLASKTADDDIPAPITAAAADRERQRHFLQIAEDFQHALRVFAEPDPGSISIIADVLDLAAGHLRAAAECDLADENQIAAAIVPAAATAVALADFVDGPCRKRVPQAHADARADALRWPRTHYANPALNLETDKHFKSLRIGSRHPHRTASQARSSRHACAFDRTIAAMQALLPDALRAGIFPVLPLLLGPDARPVPPRTDEGKLAAPYFQLARFIATIRHTRPSRKTDREKALDVFLATNDAALDRLPPDAARSLRIGYQRTRARLAAILPHIHGPENSPSKIPAWLLPIAPTIGDNKSPWCKDLNTIFRPHRQRTLADALMPAYASALVIRPRA